MKKIFDSAGTHLFRSAQTNKLSLGLVAALALLTAAKGVNAEDLTQSVTTLTTEMEYACPQIWEDLSVEIPSEFPASVWAAESQGDKDHYLTYLSQKGLIAQNPNSTQTNSQLGDKDAIISNCTAARTRLLNKFYSNLPQDVVAAMADLEYEAGDSVDGFLVGDVRFTGRLAPADGWVYPRGQTIGSASSNADFKGPEYREIYDLARNWKPNTGNEIWDQGQTIKLPYTWGRVITDAVTVGLTWGTNKTKISLAQVPSHDHTVQNAPAHTHPTSMEGGHEHKLRTDIFTGSGAPDTNAPYFEGKARPHYKNVIQKSAMTTEGWHRHNLTPAGEHNHTINKSGGKADGSTADLYLSQPTMTFRLELKIKR